MTSENQYSNLEENLPATSSQFKSDDYLDILMQNREAKAKQLIAKRESTEFTYLYNLKGQKVRRSSLILE